MNKQPIMEMRIEDINYHTVPWFHYAYFNAMVFSVINLQSLGEDNTQKKTERIIITVVEPSFVSLASKNKNK